MSTYVFAQKSIEICYDKTVYLVFPGNIVSYDVGGKEVKHKKDGNRLQLKSNLFLEDGVYYDKDYEELDWFDTNMLVELEGGYYYTFDLTYNDKPDRFFHPFELEDADYKSKNAEVLEGLESDDEFEDGISKLDAQKIKEWSGHIVESEDILSDLGGFKGGLQGKIGGIYSDRKYLYFKMSLWNESAVVYDIELINFVVDAAGKKRRKLTATYLDNKKPVFVYNSAKKAVEEDKEIYKVFVFEKFTLDPKKRLYAEVIESNGDRNIEVEIKPGHIISAVPVLNILK